MWKVIGIFVVMCMGSLSVLAQDSLGTAGGNPNAKPPIKGHLNLGVKWGMSAPSDFMSVGNDSLLFPAVYVPVFAIGYQYSSSNNLSINSQLFVGFHPFNYRFAENTSPSLFGQNGFRLPYFGASFQLYRTYTSGTYFGGGVEFHLNTTRPYRFTTEAGYTDGLVQDVTFRRNLTEYSGVQRGATFVLGKEWNEGFLNGFDAFLFVNWLDRAKLSVEYAVNRPKFFTNVSYKGSINGVGLRYHFR